MKYYVEIADITDGNYILQSDWFDTEKDAEDFIRQISYLSCNFICYIMCSKWDYENDTYTDINTFRRVNTNLLFLGEKE